MTQTEANRANAQHSTGPKTAEGRAASSRNATKSGMYAQSILIPGEDPAELDQLRDEMFHHWDPRSAEELRLVDRHIYLIWTTRRLTHCETGIWSIFMSVHKGEANPTRAFLDCDERLLRLQRLVDAKTREDNRLLDRLRKLIAERPAPVEEAQTPAPQPTPPENGFVSSNDSKDEPATARPPRPDGLFFSASPRPGGEYPAPDAQTPPLPPGGKLS